MEKKYRVFSFFLLACYHNISFGKERNNHLLSLPSRRGTGVGSAHKQNKPQQKSRANVSIILGNFQTCLTLSPYDTHIQYVCRHCTLMNDHKLPYNTCTYLYWNPSYVIDVHSYPHTLHTELPSAY